MSGEPSQRLEHNYTGPKIPGEPSQRLEHNYIGLEMSGEPSQRLEHNYTGPEMPGEPSQRLEHNYTLSEMPGEPSQRLEHNYTGSEMPGEPSQRLEHNDTGPEMPDGEPSQRLEHNDTGSEMPGEPSQKCEQKNAGPKMLKRSGTKRVDHDRKDPRNPENNRLGQSKCSKRPKQDGQLQGKECPPNDKRTSKRNLKNMKELAIEALLDHKVPLKSILDLCPWFKEKVFKNWAEEINQKVKGLQSKAKCCMAQPDELPRTRDDNVAKIKMTIAMQEIQGVILEGGSGVNVITEDLAVKLGLKWEPIPFNIRMADNKTVVPKGLIKHAKVRVGGMDYW